MINVIYSDGVDAINVSNKLYQYDYGVKLKITGIECDETTQVHFKMGNVAIVVMPEIEESSIIVDVPDVVLTDSRGLRAYIYNANEIEGHTVKMLTMNIIAREKPEDYNPEESDPTLAQLLAMINEKASKNDIGDLVEEYIQANPINGVTDEQIASAVASYLQEHPTDTLTEEEVDEIVSSYIEEHNDELKGEDGTSPTITTTPTDDGYILTITDVNGTTSVTITSSGGVDEDYIPKTTIIDYNWWSSKSELDGNVKVATAGNGKRYTYSENSEGYFSPAYQSCDIYQVGIIADGKTNNANAKPFNATKGGNLQIIDGMLVTVAGGESGNNRWHSYDNNTGGHCFEGWAKDGMQRLTMLLNEPKREDGLKEIAIFSWDRRMRDFGWTRVGCDGMYTKKSDGSYEIKDNDKEGFAFTRTFAIGHTPLQFEPMAKPQYMPGYVPNGLQTDATDTEVPDGTVYFGEDDNRLHIKINGVWKYFITENDEDMDEVMPTDITINATTTTVEKGSTINLTATITPNNATNKGVVWSTSEESIATVSSGVVSTISEGEVIITATCAADNTKNSSVTIIITDSPSSGGEVAPDEPSTETTILASKSGLSQDYIINDGCQYFACFKWGNDDYIITSDRLIGYAGGQFRTRPGIATNVYSMGELVKSTNVGDAQQSIAWGISESSIRCNANMISYMADTNTTDLTAAVTFEKNYD